MTEQRMLEKEFKQFIFHLEPIIEHVGDMGMSLYGINNDFDSKLLSEGNRIYDFLRIVFYFETTKSYINDNNVVDFDLSSFISAQSEALLEPVQTCYQMIKTMCSESIFTDNITDYVLDKPKTLKAAQILIKAYFRLRIDFGFDGDYYFSSELSKAYAHEENWRLFNIHESYGLFKNESLSLFRLDEGDLVANLPPIKTDGGIKSKRESRLYKRLKDKRSEFKKNNKLPKARFSQLSSPAVNNKIFELLSGNQIFETDNNITEYVDQYIMQIMLNQEGEYIPTQYSTDIEKFNIPPYTAPEEYGKIIDFAVQYSGISKRELIQRLSLHSAIPKLTLEKVINREQSLFINQAYLLDQAFCNVSKKRYCSDPFVFYWKAHEIIQSWSSPSDKCRITKEQLIERLQNMF